MDHSDGAAPSPSPQPIPAGRMTACQFVGPYLVSPCFSVDASGGSTNEDYGIFFEAPVHPDPLWTRKRDGYSVHSAPDPLDWQPYPTVFLRHEGVTVGFYAGGEAWVDPPHRRRKLAAQMIVAAATLCGTAPQGNLEGLGYSEAGYRAHLAAHRILRQRARRQDAAGTRLQATQSP